MIHPSDLIINPDGSIYHLNLKPEQLANKIILAGDPSRIDIISSKFDQIEFKITNREFVCHTGTYNMQRISAISTGIGADNIDIVLNELDALVNIDFNNRCLKPKLTKLDIVRIGTCGSMQKDLDVDQLIVSTHAIGLDGLLNFYKLENSLHEKAILDEFLAQTEWPTTLNKPYLVTGDEKLIQHIGKGFVRGITLTANGFYAPQGRAIRIHGKFPDLNDRIRKFNYKTYRIENYEMETSALYGLSRLMGHRTCTVCTVVANRYSNTFSKNFQIVLSSLIDKVLERLTTDSV